MNRYEEEYESEVKDTRTYLAEETDDIVSVSGTPLPHPFSSKGFYLVYVHERMLVAKMIASVLY